MLFMHHYSTSEVERSRSYSNNEYTLEQPVDPENAVNKPEVAETLDEEDLIKKMNSQEYSTNRGQFMKLFEKKKAEVDPNKFVWPTDSWDAYLIPQEPDPSYYDTYEGKIHIMFVRQKGNIEKCICC